jgi:hypothetical protein
MRSLVLALALAAPVSAVASTPMYSNPLSSAHHHAEQQEVLITFVNYTSQEREVRIGDHQYSMLAHTVFQKFVPVGSLVRVYSNVNTKVNGQELLQVSANDAGKSVFLK